MQVSSLRVAQLSARGSQTLLVTPARSQMGWADGSGSDRVGGLYLL